MNIIPETPVTVEGFEDYKIIRTLFSDNRTFPLKPLRFSSHPNYGRVMCVMIRVAELCHAGFKDQLYFNRLTYFSNMMYQAILRKPHLNIESFKAEQKAMQENIIRLHEAFKITGIFQISEDRQAAIMASILSWSEIFGKLTINDIEKLERIVDDWLDKQTFRQKGSVK